MKNKMTYEERVEQIQKLLKKKGVPLTSTDIADELDLCANHVWILMRAIRKDKLVKSVCKHKRWFFTAK